MVRFHMHTPPAKETGAAVGAHGGKKYEPVEYVDIDLAGDGKHVVSRRAADMDRRLYREEYALFKKAAGEGHRRDMVTDPIRVIMDTKAKPSKR